MSKLNLEHLALNRVCEKYRHLRRGGAARAVRSLDVDLDDPLPFIPDAWFAMRLVYEDESEGVLFPRAVGCQLEGRTDNNAIRHEP